MNISSDIHKILRVNSIVDNPSPIESMYHLDAYNLLAIGRQDNTIEIWSTKTWVQLIKIFGDKNNSIRRVFLYKKEKENTKNLFDNLRLFSIGLNGYLIEWSLFTLKPKIFYQNPGGCLWDVDFIPSKKICLLGCDDGSVRAIRIKRDEFVLEKQFSKTDSKITSIKSSGEIFYTGLSNGTILKWEFNSGRVLATFNILSSKVQKRLNHENSIIWTLSEISNKYLFSGDSKGNFRVWDTEFGVVVKEFKEHIADVLTSCVNQKSQTVYFTGSDSLICSIQLINDEWILTSKFRGQSHDVNTIVLMNEEFLLSGGFTTDVCIYKLVDSRFVEKYDKKVPTHIKRHISAFEQKSKIYTAINDEDNILILHRKLNSINLWSVFNHNVELLAEVNKKSDSHIISANISKSGQYFSYSDYDNTFLFKYDLDNNDIKKLKTFKNISSRFIHFSEDENNLIMLDQVHRNVNIYNLKNELTESINLNLDKSEIILTCDYFDQSSDKFLAFSTLNKNLFFVNLSLKKVEPNLPCPDQFVTQLKFLNKNTLIAVGMDNKFVLIDFNNFKFNEWTKNNLSNFPKNYLKWYNKIIGLCRSNLDENLFLLYTDYNYIKIDLTKEIPQISLIKKEKMEKIRNAEWGKMIKEYHKRIFKENYKNMRDTEIEKEIFNEDEDDVNNGEKRINFENDNFGITSRFSSILFMDYLNLKKSENEKVLLVIENDWNKILKEFPDAVAKFNYGY